MDSAFDDLDAAGFLEIWQHFDADGEDSWLYFYLYEYIQGWCQSPLLPQLVISLDKEK